MFTNAQASPKCPLPLTFPCLKTNLLRNSAGHWPSFLAHSLVQFKSFFSFLLIHSFYVIIIYQLIANIQFNNCTISWIIVILLGLYSLKISNRCHLLLNISYSLTHLLINKYKYIISSKIKLNLINIVFFVFNASKKLVYRRTARYLL